MKYLFILALTVSSLLAFSSKALADVNIDINAPSQGISANTPVGLVISNLLTIILIVGVIAVLFMLAIGGFEWVTSGGDKDRVAQARGKIVNAIIGLIILSLAFLLASTLGSITNINLLNSVLPRLDQGASTPGVNFSCPGCTGGMGN